MMKQITLRKVLFILCLACCASSFVPAPAALVGGFLFTLLLGNPMPKFSSKSTSLLLKASVVGIGFGMNINEAMQTGKEGFWLTVASISITLTVGYFVGRALKIDRKMAYLTSCGTAICGGSAIAAVSPAIKAEEKQVSVALGVVFLLNSIALIIFPIMGHYFGLTQHQFGLWSAIAIHDTSSVVGAAATYGEEALMVATTVKLTRALWIIPISIMSIFLFKSNSSKISIPWFILLFIVAMAINSYLPIGQAGIYLFKISKTLLVATLFLIGSALSIESLKATGIRPLVLGVILWIVISILSLLAVLYL